MLIAPCLNLTLITVQVPLTPALRAAKAARELALQRAPLTRRSEAILYQVCRFSP